jgi:hypothetical protein
MLHSNSPARMHGHLSESRNLSVAFQEARGKAEPRSQGLTSQIIDIVGCWMTRGDNRQG